MASWSDLPLDLLGVVLACFITSPVDRARIAAVCRSWRSAVRHHERPRLPWIVARDREGHVYIPFDLGGRLLPLQHFPEAGVSVAGSTDSWLAVGLGFYHAFGDYIHNSYVLPLTVLGDVITNIKTCHIHKFLMRSSVADDFIAVVTNNLNYPLIVFRQGKGAWVAPPYRAPCIYIIDIAFLGDTLYAITNTEDLIPLDLALDDDGKPLVTIGKRVIRRPPGYYYDAWASSDDDDSEEDEEEEDDDEDIYEEENGEVLDDNGNIEEEVEDHDNIEEAVLAHDEVAPQEHVVSHHASYSGQFTHVEETGELIFISRHLMVSCGKLLMVRRHRKVPPNNSTVLTCRVDVLEADASIGAWVPLPVSSGLGGGRALFISMCLSKAIYAPCGEVEEDVVYDIDTGQVFDMKSQTSREARFCKPSQGMTWLFPPEVVH